MKIDNSISPIPSGKTEGISSHSSQPVKSSDPVVRKDTASVSGEAMLLSKTRAALDATPAVRVERVNELKESVANGTYSVPVEKLASILTRHINTQI